MHRAKIILPLITLSLVACAANKKIIGYADNYIERKSYRAQNGETEFLSLIETCTYNKEKLKERKTKQYSRKEPHNLEIESTLTNDYDSKGRIIKMTSLSTWYNESNPATHTQIITYEYSGNTTIEREKHINPHEEVESESETTITETKIKEGRKVETIYNSKLYFSGETEEKNETRTEIYDKLDRKIKLQSVIIDKFSMDTTEITQDTVITFESETSDNYVSKTVTHLINANSFSTKSSEMEIGQFAKDGSREEITGYSYDNDEFKDATEGYKTITTLNSENATSTTMNYKLKDDFDSEEDWELISESLRVYDKNAYYAIVSYTSTSYEDGEISVTVNSTSTNDEYGRCTESHGETTEYSGTEVTRVATTRYESKYGEPIPVYKK